MRRLPLAFVERIFRLPFMQRPRLLVHTSHKSPSAEELPPNLMIIEIRSGYLKWVHLLCPKRGDHIQLPLAGAERWSISVDLLRRPTLAPLMWKVLVRISSLERGSLFCASSL